MTLNVIMLGPPGAGKGTQAELLSRSRRIPRISTGDILRQAARAGTDLGRRVKAIMDRGELVGDDVMIGIVRERLEEPDAQNGFVLEGFPRTVPQAQALDAIMNGRDPLIVIDIEVPDTELLRRLGTRLICCDCGTTADPADPPPVACAGCSGRLVQRSDDADEVVRERLKGYHRQSEPLVQYYRPRPTFRSVNGLQPPDRVTADLTAAITAAAAGRPPVDALSSGPGARS